MPASCVLRARTMSSPTATCCISALRRELAMLDSPLPVGERSDCEAIRVRGSFIQLKVCNPHPNPLPMGEGATDPCVKYLMPFALVANGAEVLVDPEYDQNEFGRN